MPELPEVETTKRGIAPHIINQRVVEVIIRQPKLRWLIPTNLQACLLNKNIVAVERRGKYLLIKVADGYLVLHLGMSGRLQVLPQKTIAAKHDHLDIVFANNKVLRFTDPRRFGAVLWMLNPVEHKLLATLGPEPLSNEFNVDYLIAKAKNRQVPIKTFIMNSKVVVGVGNIYANEALFNSGIRPTRKTGSISKQQLAKLVEEVKKVLTAAIKQGGTTLKDFYGVDGQSGYFALALAVYGRGGEPCRQCKTVLKEVRLAQRQTVYCSQCQR